jgi:LacI family transcriptional regulator
VANIFDVAARAGVGVGTVSRVLNQSPLVSDATRARVLTVIDELDYRPSSLARGLSLGRTNTIGIAVPFFTTPSAVQRLRGFARVLADTDYQFMVLNVENEQQRAAALRSVAGDQVDGAAIVSLKPVEAELRRLRSDRTVFVDSMVPGFASVYSDDEDGGRMATRHLISLGHTRIAFLGDRQDLGFSSPSTHRRQGYVEALREAGLDIDPSLVFDTDPPVGHDVIDRILEDAGPTAVFAAYDMVAFSVVEAARERGVRIPEDLSVIGFDDIETAGLVGLTTIRQPLEESGEQAAHLLLALLNDETVLPTHEQQKLYLIERDTTGVRS